MPEIHMKVFSGILAARNLLAHVFRELYSYLILMYKWFSLLSV